MSSTPLEQLYQMSPKGISLGLERMISACDLLGNPQERISVIQVAGTNGKGSVSNMLERGCRATGMRTGLFTSPHIHRFTERFQINGVEISHQRMEGPLSRVLEMTIGESGIQLTFFEVATLTAFLIFAEEKVDVAVMEVGLGGRLDATSVANAVVGVITSIGFDHQEYLGNSIGAIAREKAAIAKPGMTLVCGNVDDAARRAIAQVSEARGAVLCPVEESISDAFFEDLNAPFFVQAHQRHNASLAATAFEQYSAQCGISVQRDVFLGALRSFGVPARFEWIDHVHGARYLLDGAHNMEAMQALINTIGKEHIPISRIIFGALQGKPVDDMLTLLQSVTPVIELVEAPVARTMNGAKVAEKWGLPLVSLDAALASRASNGGVTLVTGSFFVAAEARQKLLGEFSNTPVAL